MNGRPLERLIFADECAPWLDKSAAANSHALPPDLQDGEPTFTGVTAS